MCKGFGWRLRGEVWGDANAALGVINRTGLGTLIHIQTSFLWIQHVVAEQRFKYGKVLGTSNPADFFTKHLGEKTCLHHIDTLGYRVTEGRPEYAPQVHQISMSMDDLQVGEGRREWPWLQYLHGPRGYARTKAKHDKSRSGLNMLQCGEQQDTELSVFRGYKRRVKGSNGRATAQLSRPRGSTQTIPPEHDRVQCICSGGHARARGIAHIPMVVSREGMARLLSQKCPHKEGAPNAGSNVQKDAETITIGMGSAANITQHILQRQSHRRPSSLRPFRLSLATPLRHSIHHSSYHSPLRLHHCPTRRTHSPKPSNSRHQRQTNL